MNFKERKVGYMGRIGKMENEKKNNVIIFKRYL